MEMELVGVKVDEESGEDPGVSESLVLIPRQSNHVGVVPKLPLLVFALPVEDGSLPPQLSQTFLVLGNTLMEDLKEWRLDLIEVKVGNLALCQKQMEEKVKSLEDRVTSMEDFVHNFNEELDPKTMEWVRKQEQRLLIQEELIPGPHASHKKNAMKTLRGMSRHQQFLVALGMICLTIMSFEVATWAFPYVVTEVSKLSKRFKRLKRKARDYLKNVTFVRLLRLLSRKRQSNYSALSDLLKDPLVCQMQLHKYPGTVLAFASALVHCIRSDGDIIEEHQAENCEDADDQNDNN